MQKGSEAEKTDRGQDGCPRKTKPLIGENNIRNNRTRRIPLTSNTSTRIAPATIHTRSIAGRNFGEVEESVANDYESGEARCELCHGTRCAPAVNSVWDRMSGVITPRDRDRGMRDSI